LKLILSSLSIPLALGESWLDLVRGCGLAEPSFV
jgi:hypothetical protein